MGDLKSCNTEQNLIHLRTSIANMGMERSKVRELDDEAVHLIQRALYIEPLSSPVDLEKVPEDGHEYIHQVRQEELKYFPEGSKTTFLCIPVFDSVEGGPDEIGVGRWQRREANSFSYLAIALKKRRQELREKFPAKRLPCTDDEQDCCMFCLGSELYTKIYGDKNVVETEGNYPYLSVVLHLKQDDIITLLKYMAKWISIITMNDAIAMWVFALLACLLKPVPDHHESFLESFYDDLKRKVQICEKDEKFQLFLISAILKHYFCVKAYKIGPALDKFVKLV